MATVDERFAKFFQATKSEAQAQEELRSFADNMQLMSTLPCHSGLYRYRGVWLLEKHLRGVLSSQKHFLAYPTDIFLDTYPKCGTTWIKALALAVLNRSVMDNNDNHSLLNVHPQDCHVPLETVFSYPHLPDLGHMPRPRTFTSHLPYFLLPDSVKGDDGGSRIVYVSRDPKDALVSMCYFINDNIAGLSEGETLDFSLKTLYDDFVAGNSVYGPIWDHQMEYKRESLKRPEKVLYLVYEEMKAKPEESVRKLAAFLGQPFTEEEVDARAVEEIVRLCSIEFMKKLWKNDKGMHEGAVKNSSFFRKGTVGDWKDHLTLEMAERIDQITQQKLNEFGLN